MAKISVYLRTDRLDSFGRAPVQIKVWEGKVSYYHKVENASVVPDLWIEDQRCVKAAHPNATLINRKIKSDIIKIEGILLDMGMRNLGFNRDILKQKIKGHNHESVYDFWERVIKSREGNIAASSMQILKSELKKIREYRTSLSFNEITLEFLEGYEAWLRTVKKNKPNSINKSMKKLTYIINRANQTIGVDCKAFQHYKKPSEKTIRDVIDLQQLDTLLLKLFSGAYTDRGMNDAASIFCLQALTGLRFSDAVNFNVHEYIHDGKIMIKTEKTGESVYIPIHGRLLELLNFRNYEFNKLTLQGCNRILKAVGLDLNLSFPLSSHIAVHSFCTISLELGMGIEIISKVRGHSNIKTTQIYTRVKNRLIEQEMKKWDAMPLAKVI